MRFATAPYRHCWKLCLSRQVGIPLCGTRFIGECLPNGENGRLGFLTSPICSAQLILKSTIILRAGQVAFAPPTISPFLFQDDHLSQLQIIARTQLVEIDTTGNPLSQSVAAVPIRRTTAVRVVPRTLMPQIQFAHQRTVYVVDREGHSTVVR